MTNKGPQRAAWRPWLLVWFGMLVLVMANGTSVPLSRSCGAG
jgi:hypothetical protein